MNKYVIFVEIETDGPPDVAISYTRTMAHRIAAAIRLEHTLNPATEILKPRIETSIPSPGAQVAAATYKPALPQIQPTDDRIIGAS